jgi:NAD(P)-dependent dehydrogenase (short-subunit alcohol dehydrogenase family)
MQELAGKAAIITGAGTGIGRAIALAFAEAGMTVVCAGRRQEPLDETVAAIAEHGGEALVLPTHVTDPAQVQAMVDRTLEAYGAVDVLYNNAGSFTGIGPLWEVDADRWWQDVETNLRGSMLCAQAVLPHMIERGSGMVINMSGGGAAGPMVGGSGYGSSKAALLRLTDSLARELTMIESPVLVYAMDPGFNPTDMTRSVAGEPAAQAWLPRIGRRLETGEGHQPEDCARTSVELVRLAPRCLHGRTVFAADDIAALERNAEAIETGDLRALRLREAAQ